MVFFPFAEHKLGAPIALVCCIVVIGSIEAKLHSYYEKTGRAVRIHYPRIEIRFAKGMPLSMVGTRLAVLVIVAIMLTLGLAPISIDEAKPGIIACVLALFVLMFVDWIAEEKSIKDGHATEVTLPDE